MSFKTNILKSSEIKPVLGIVTLDIPKEFNHIMTLPGSLGYYWIPFLCTKTPQIET